MRTLLGVLAAAALLLAALAAQAGIVDGVFSPAAYPAVPPQAVEVDRALTPVMIDFDDTDAPCVFADTFPLRDQYLALGVSFSGPASSDGGAVLNECGSFGVSGHSAPNFLAFNCASTMQNGGTPQGPETLTFTEVVSSCSVLAGSNTDQGSALTMHAYSADEQLLAMDTIILAPTLQLLGVEATGIKTVVIGSTEPCVWVVDDLGFDTASTPVEDLTWTAIKALYE